MTFRISVVDLNIYDDKWVSKELSTHRTYRSSLLWAKYALNIEKLWRIELPQDSTGITLNANGPGELLFYKTGTEITILSSLFEFNDELIKEIVSCIFRQFWAIEYIKFQEMKTTSNVNRDDICITKGKRDYYYINLPETENIFNQSLRDSVRTRLRYKENKLFRQFPRASFVMTKCLDINENNIRDLVNIYTKRSKIKGYNQSLTPESLMKLLPLIQKVGYLFMLKNDGNTCAAILCLTQNRTMFLQYITHDPQYDKYSPGLNCLHFAIRKCIEMKFEIFNFQPMHMKYKDDFGALTEEVETIIYARNRFFCWFRRLSRKYKGK